MTNQTPESVIAEVIEYHADTIGSHYDGCHKHHAPCLAVKLRDMLREPGEPNDDREWIAAILQLRHPGNMYSTCERDADAILAAGFFRATVPDAATEAKNAWHLSSDVWQARALKAEAERDAALAELAKADAATAEAKKQLGEIQRHFTAIAGSGEIRVYEDTGEKHGIDYQSSVWAKRGERMTRDLIEFLGEHHRPEPVGNGESK